MEGTVKWFNRKKGFGFVKGDDGQDYFVHYTSLPSDVVLNENERVTFDPVETDKGKQAQNVTLGAGEAPEDSGEASKDSGEAPEDSGEASKDSGETSKDRGEAPEDSGEAPEEPKGKTEELPE